MYFIFLSKISQEIQQEIEEDRKQRRNQFEEAVNKLKQYVFGKCDDMKADDVGEFEKGGMVLLMMVGLRAVQLFLACKRQVPTRRRMIGMDGRAYKYVKEKVYTVRSIFGEGEYVSSQYHRGEKLRARGEICILDGQVGLLPAGGLSPLLALEVVNLCTRMAYAQAQEVLRLFRRYVPSTRSICGIIDLIGNHAEGVLDDVPCKGGEVAVIQCDGRGAPMIREEEYQKRCSPHKKRNLNKKHEKGRRRRICLKNKMQAKKLRRTRGEKSKNKKQVTVGLIYSLNRCKDGSWEGPYGKFIARFGDAESVFKRLKNVLDGMGESVKKIVFISDGAPVLRRLQLKYFPTAIAVIDFYHVSEYLWKAGETIYKEGSEELEGFVELLKEKLRNGEVHEVLSILCGKMETIPLRGPGTKGRRKRMQQAIDYISKRVNQMPYKELREHGLEIGSGAIEGAVRQIVAIRFDGPGMKWGEHRPQLLLHMICIRLSGGWDTFVQTIIQWAHQTDFRRRITPVGVNEKTANKTLLLDNHLNGNHQINRLPILDEVEKMEKAA